MSHDDTYDDTQGLVAAACEGRLQDLIHILDHAPPSMRSTLFTVPFEYKEMRGNLLTLVALSHHKNTLAHLVTLPGCDINASLAVFACTQFRRFDMTLCLLGLGADVNHAMPVTEDTLLHYVCKYNKPPASFISEICRLRSLHVNAINAEGLNALHLVCLHAGGVEGRDAVKTLVQRGILFDAPTPAGKLPTQITQNPFIREALGLYHFGRRTVPRMTPELQNKYDSIETSKVPDGFGVSVEGSTTPTSVKEKQGKTLSKDAEANLVQRVYTDSIQQRKKWRDDKMLGLDGPGKAALSQDTIDDCTVRLCNKSMEDKAASMSAAYAKFLPDVERKTLPPDEIKDSASRLSSVEKSKAVQAQLWTKYTHREVHKTLSKKEMQVSVARQYSETMQKQSEKKAALAESYFKKDTSLRFHGSTQKTMEEWIAMGQRMYDKRKVN